MRRPSSRVILCCGDGDIPAHLRLPHHGNRYAKAPSFQCREPRATSAFPPGTGKPWSEFTERQSFSRNGTAFQRIAESQQNPSSAGYITNTALRKAPHEETGIQMRPNL